MVRSQLLAVPCLFQAHALGGAGHGLWLDRERQSCLILWKQLEGWAATIHDWARGSGMQDQVMTVDELSSGDEVRGTGEALYLPKPSICQPGPPMSVSMAYMLFWWY